ncbi:type III-A CRISPR-associated protein Csm2 [Desulfurella sp.]|uniref:type III-A CRISPR-associated protein Csm2 n=1 Tax=Desulfurella sp. TaxID=1962857 RepID=UPI0025C6830E|nr:type III-A CRISPR-associated protein Csm2 [Desulfurella sp.]
MNERENFYGNVNRGQKNPYQHNENRNRYPGITPKDYFKEPNSDIVKDDLFSVTADKITESFSKEGGITGSQIRKFYDEVLRLKLKLDSASDKETKFVEILPYLKMLIPKVIYSKNRNNANESFESFIKMNIENITKVREFEVFCDLFEAIIAYTKKYPNLKK